MDGAVTAVLMLVAVTLTALAQPLVNYLLMKYRHRKLDGPRGLPFFGNVFQLGSDGVAMPKVMTLWSEQFREQGFFLMYFGMEPAIVITTAKHMERIVCDVNLDLKSFGYYFLKPWLGDGLLMSTGSKWAWKRKLLTQSFHFTILNTFLDVFNERAECLAEKLCTMADGRSVDVTPLTALCALDIISETIMGYDLGAQEGRNEEYVEALHSLGPVIVHRAKTPWLWNDFIFRNSSSGKEAARCVGILHDMTKKVFRERKRVMLDRASDDVIIDDQSRDVRKQRRLALLDLLLEVQRRDGSLTDDDILEEMDTFMFAGHDTVSTSITFTLYLIGRHQDVQDKLHEELDRVFGTSDRGHVTREDLAGLQYLSRVIKESLRLFPPGAFLGRKVEEGISACGITIPRGTSIYMNIFDLHRDPKQFPNPEKFDPDRFLATASETRHPFAYMPFSAGHRNCIGQKFAILEQKVVIASILKKLKVKSLQEVEDLRLSGDFILRPLSGIHLEFDMRE